MNVICCYHDDCDEESCPHIIPHMPHTVILPDGDSTCAEVANTCSSLATWDVRVICVPTDEMGRET